eukprot:758403-Hanusia_phi.AAC.2
MNTGEEGGAGERREKAGKEGRAGKPETDSTLSVYEDGDSPLMDGGNFSSLEEDEPPVRETSGPRSSSSAGKKKKRQRPKAFQRKRLYQSCVDTDMSCSGDARTDGRLLDFQRSENVLDRGNSLHIESFRRRTEDDLQWALLTEDLSGQEEKSREGGRGEEAGGGTSVCVWGRQQREEEEEGGRGVNGNEQRATEAR